MIVRVDQRIDIFFFQRWQTHQEADILKRVQFGQGNRAIG
jgi:hypothetical protein